MAELTRIAWSRSTFSGWIGCARISPACDHCYAEAIDKRFHGGAHWGAGASRKLGSDKYWLQPLRWNAQAAVRQEFWPVFCASQADVFENEVPQEWRERLWTLIRATPYLPWQILTKRIGNAASMLPSDWGNGYPNVWLISTCANQLEADRDIRKLLAVPVVIHGLSIEPALGPVNLKFSIPRGSSTSISRELNCERSPGIDWVIVGGESKQEGPAREFRLEWCESIVDQCRAHGVAVFVKQMGHNPTVHGMPIKFTGKGDVVDEWPVALRIQEFPRKC